MIGKGISFGKWWMGGALGDFYPTDDDAYWLGTDTLGWKGVKFPDMALVAASTYTEFRLSNLVDWSNARMAGLIFNNWIYAGNDAAKIQSRDIDDNYITFEGRVSGVGEAEVARIQGAADPYFSFGGSQEYKFYESGIFDIGANIIRTTNCAIKEESAYGISIREDTDDAYLGVYASFFQLQSAGGIYATDSDDAGAIIYGRDNGVGLVEVAKIQGAADPWFGLGVSGNAIKATNSGLLGFFGATPRAQCAKASFNNWATFGDVVDALVALGLFDAA